MLAWEGEVLCNYPCTGTCRFLGWPGEGAGSPGTGIIGRCRLLSGGHWGWNSSSVHFIFGDLVFIVYVYVYECLPVCTMYIACVQWSKRQMRRMLHPWDWTRQMGVAMWVLGN